MPLGDADTLPQAIETTAAVVSEGMEYIATHNGIGLTEVLRRTSLERLFRVGASLLGRKPPRTPEADDVEDEADEASGTPSNPEVVTDEPRNT